MSFLSLVSQFGQVHVDVDREDWRDDDEPINVYLTDPVSGRSSKLYLSIELAQSLHSKLGVVLAQLVPAHDVGIASPDATAFHSAASGSAPSSGGDGNPPSGAITSRHPRSQAQINAAFFKLDDIRLLLQPIVDGCDVELTAYEIARDVLAIVEGK
ncbi:hypothetical protein ACHIPZ_13650 [Antrihabitans sp. NCIMB 15449]|uniref:Uncharacterized protein n=1 Tax=Antrihabitans spumae TaxID=3373370 RepID=A0ABW7JQJ4_9NOCA